MHKLRWKHIYRINSSVCIEKVMWLCAMRWDNLTSSVHSIYMLLWSFWKAWAKSVGKVFLYNCLIRLRFKQLPSTSESNGRIYCFVCSLWGASNLYHIWKLLYSVSFSSLLRLYPKSPPIPSNSALFEGTAILSGVQNHSGCFRVHSFNPTMHRKNECTTDVHSTARESP